MKDLSAISASDLRGISAVLTDIDDTLTHPWPLACRGL